MLCQRDELVGRDEPEGGVLPADEGLDALDLAGVEGGFGLVVEDELALGDGGPQLAEKRQPGGGVEVEVVVVDDDVGVRTLGHVHGYVGSLEEKVGAVAVGWGDGDPAAGFDVQGHAVDLEGLFEQVHDPFGHLDGGGEAADIGKQHAELVAAEPG